MYKLESIKKAVRLMNDTIEKYSSCSVDDIKICISSGNVKIGRVLNVSLPPVISCGNCKECMHYCYDIKACLQYPNTVIDARVRNYMILKKDRSEYFRRIREKLARRRVNKFMRWHVSGDILDLDYFANMVSIARDFPAFRFWTYTKMYSIVNEYCDKFGRDAIPSNFSIMFSEWDGMPLDNPYNFPVFSVKMQAGNINHAPEYFDNLYQCPGNCDVCKACGRGCIFSESVYCNEH